MKFFFQKSFISEVKTLLKKNSYKDCERAIIKDIFKLKSDDLLAQCVAYRLNPNAKNPIAKLRVGDEQGKSSSFRVYLIAIAIKNNYYFGYIYPKQGVYGKNALKSKEETKIIKDLLSDIKEDNVIEVKLNKDKDKICFVSDNKEIFK
ncbi:hypothetical protein [Galbibacter sp. PAP.153]|uniref:hypothetical protein n=1 Tax=Galbibacter sp. PAP.153 TaxID=3104623 RepID=UPI0030097C09